MLRGNVRRNLDSGGDNRNNEAYKTPEMCFSGVFIRII